MKFILLLSLLFLLKIGCKIQHSVSPELDQLVRGKIAYQVPNEMKIDSPYKVVVSISKAESDRILFTGLDSIRFKKDTIKVSSRVKMILIDPSGNDNFKIVSLNTEEQLVDDSSNTVWNWSVIPLRAGENDIVIRASAKVLDRFGENYRDIQIFEKKISIQSSPFRNIKQFISDNWQWIFSVIIVPLIIWRYRKWSENRKSKT